jgi:hypothetical protein
MKLLAAVKSAPVLRRSRRRIVPPWARECARESPPFYRLRRVSDVFTKAGASCAIVVQLLITLKTLFGRV